MTTLTTAHEIAAERDLPAAQRRLRVDEVIQMAEVGIISERERLELIDGTLIEMSPEGADQADTVATVSNRLVRLYPEAFQIRSQNTQPLDEYSYLEPDVLVVRPRPSTRPWPTADDIVLVIEVARTSARRDRLVKAELYAAWGAPVYWIVDLNRRVVVVHTDPAPEGYANIRTLTGGAVDLPEIGGTTPVAEFLPPA